VLVNHVKNKAMKDRISVLLLVLSVVFCVSLVAANLLEIKIIQLGSITITGGFLIFPVSYIINDCVTEVWGFSRTRLLIWLGFAVNFGLLAVFQLALALPAAPFWEGEAAFRFVFGLAPRIATASLLAFVVGSLLNAHIMTRMKLASQGKYFSLRAIVSSFAGESADFSFRMWERDVAP